MITFHNIHVEVSAHFIERYRERMLQMSPSMWKNYTPDYRYKLRNEMRQVIPKCQKILFRDLEPELQRRLHVKHNRSNQVFFYRKDKGVLYVGAYVKHSITHQETVLLLTLMKKKLNGNV